MLAMLLDSLAKQIFCQTFEVIVVDNDPAGGGAEVVEAVRQRYPDLNIRYSVEPQKGISFARNTAASLATGDFIAWIDDDETAAEQAYVTMGNPACARRWGCSVRCFQSFPRFTSGPNAAACSIVRTCYRHRHRCKRSPQSNAFVKASWLRSFASPFDIKTG
jgi:glycosyltransferase involved in cell wall biosynthesis